MSRSRVQVVSADVVQAVASRMLDPMPPFVGYFAFAGELSSHLRILGGGDGDRRDARASTDPP